MTPVRHFLSLFDLGRDELEWLVHRAIELKAMHRAQTRHEPLYGRVVGLIFEKSSTRTRVSFEAGISQLGGQSIFLSPRDSQLGRGEPVEDTARVLSRMVDAIVVRTFEHEKLECLAQHSRVPVINALTDRHHPCQLLADVQTFVEHRGSIAGRTVAWVGDGNNMCNSFIQAARQFGFRLRIGCPTGYAPSAKALGDGGNQVMLTEDPAEAVRGADMVVTDVWASMGQEAEQQVRAAAFAPYQVNAEMVKLASDDALVMHCLPAHRGEEIAASVLEGPQSVVWDEAENRLHSQKALLELLLVVRPM